MGPLDCGVCTGRSYKIWFFLLSKMKNQLKKSIQTDWRFLYQSAIRVQLFSLMYFHTEDHSFTARLQATRKGCKEHLISSSDGPVAHSHLYRSVVISNSRCRRSRYESQSKSQTIPKVTLFYFFILFLYLQTLTARAKSLIWEIYVQFIYKKNNRENGREHHITRC